MSRVCFPAEANIETVFDELSIRGMLRAREVPVTGMGLLKYLPSILSIIVSVVCLYYVFAILKARAPDLYGTREFLYGSLLVLVVWMPLVNYLDQHLRIDWIP